VAHYLGNPSPDEKPLSAFARALGYADQAELENAMEERNRDLADMISRAIGPNQYSVPLAKDRVRAKSGTVDPCRDLLNRLGRAEDRVCERFSIHIPSLEYSDAKRVSETLKRMEAGLP
jgi:hypothetical protein